MKSTIAKTNPHKISGHFGGLCKGQGGQGQDSIFSDIVEELKFGHKVI